MYGLEISKFLYFQASEKLLICFQSKPKLCLKLGRIFKNVLDVRLDLLDAKHQRPLTAVLSALLMILPQTDAFNTLHKRIQCIPPVVFHE